MHALKNKSLIGIIHWHLQMFGVLTFIFTEKDIILIFASVLCSSKSRELNLSIFHLTEILKNKHWWVMVNWIWILLIIVFIFQGVRFIRGTNQQKFTASYIQKPISPRLVTFLIQLVYFHIFTIKNSISGDKESGKTTLIAKLQANEDPKKGAGLEYGYIDVRDEYRDGKSILNFSIKSTFTIVHTGSGSLLTYRTIY